VCEIGNLKICGDSQIDVRKLLLVALVVALAGCQSAKPAPAASPAPPPVVAEPAPAEPAAPQYVAEPGLKPQQRIERAVKLLEKGETGQARAELEAYLAAIPNSKVAQDLVRQIDVPSSEYYPATSREVTLGAGDSFSVLAQKYLGSYYQFYALAKYNGVAVPRDISAGRKIRIPLTPHARQVFEAPAEAAPAASAEAPAEAAPDTATPAPSAAPAGWTLVSTLIAENKYEAAAQEIERSSRLDALTREQRQLGVSAYRNSAEALASRDPSRASARLLQAGKWLATDHSDMAALDVLQRSAALDPGNAAAQKAYTDFRTNLADTYHKEASAAFRQQDLDRAIALWEKVLTIDPNHKFAQANLNQARELKAKLEKLK
jgi:tetratricopeptide (TPR) repeat protein